MHKGHTWKQPVKVLGLMACLAAACSRPDNVITYPAPEGETPSQDFTVKAGGKPVFVYQARVSAMPTNQLCLNQGQRPLDQTEIASFAYFDFEGSVAVEVTSMRGVQSVKIRPESYGILPAVTGNKITFNLNRPGKMAVEVNGWHKALHLFTNQIKDYQVQPGDSAVHYFGPGVHTPGVIELKDRQTVYIAGGAVVHGAITGNGVSNIKILGHGILDASTFKRFGVDRSQRKPNMVSLRGCSNVEIDGPIFRDAHTWTLRASQCQTLSITDVKLIGMWRYNSDGIDLCSCQEVKVADCFVRSFDDAIVIKGLTRRRRDATEEDKRPSNVRDIEVSGCVLWCDWGRACEIGAETRVDSLGRILFKDCDVIHYVQYALDIQNGDRGLVHDVRYEDIRVEEPILEYAVLCTTMYLLERLGTVIGLVINQDYYSRDATRGNITDVYYKDISYRGSVFPRSIVWGYDQKHLVQNVTIENFTINGRRVATLEDGNIQLKNAFNRNIVIK